MGPKDKLTCVWGSLLPLKPMPDIVAIRVSKEELGEFLRMFLGTGAEMKGTHWEYDSLDNFLSLTACCFPISTT